METKKWNSAGEAAAAGNAQAVDQNVVQTAGQALEQQADDVGRESEGQASCEANAGTRTILYLHGFLSSPSSSKVTALADGIAQRAQTNARQPTGQGAAEMTATAEVVEMAEDAPAQVDFVLAAPDLNVPPPLVDAYLRALASTYDPERLTIVGSSLGGFYAGRLANITGARVVLLNPCLNPWDFVKNETGERAIYGTDRRIFVAARFADDFRALAEAVPPVPADLKRTLAVLSTADEVLDWRLAWNALRGAGIILSAGDDHRIARFSRYVSAILNFAAKR